MRLVFQPLHQEGSAEDAGFHAFYAVRTDEITGAVAALRDLAMIAPPQTGAIRVSPALGAANPGAYATKLRTFVKRYGGEARIVRLTMNAQPQVFAQVRWVFRGVEKKGDVFVDMPLVGASATDISESVILNGGSSYDVMPITDTPSGLLGAIQKTMFDAANVDEAARLLRGAGGRRESDDPHGGDGGVRRLSRHDVRDEHARDRLVD